MLADFNPAPLPLFRSLPAPRIDDPPGAVSVFELGEASGTQRRLILLFGQPLGILERRQPAGAVAAHVWNLSRLALCIDELLYSHYRFPRDDAPQVIVGPEPIAHFWLRHGETVLSALKDVQAESIKPWTDTVEIWQRHCRHRILEQLLSTVFDSATIGRLLAQLHLRAGRWRELLVRIALNNPIILTSWPVDQRDDGLLPLFLYLRSPHCGPAQLRELGFECSLLQRLRHLPAGLVWDIVNGCDDYSCEARAAYLALLETLFRIWWRNLFADDPLALSRLELACELARVIARIHSTHPAAHDTVGIQAVITLFDPDDEERVIFDLATPNEGDCPLAVARLVPLLECEALRIVSRSRQALSRKSVARRLRALPEWREHMRATERWRMLALLRQRIPDLPDDEDLESEQFRSSYRLDAQPDRWARLRTCLLLDGRNVTLVALDTFVALYREGTAMRHCAAECWPHIEQGGLCVFSLRIDGKRWGTLSLAGDVTRAGTTWQLSQYKGRLNLERMGELHADHELHLHIESLRHLLDAVWARHLANSPLHPVFPHARY